MEEEAKPEGSNSILKKKKPQLFFKTWNNAA